MYLSAARGARLTDAQVKLLTEEEKEIWGQLWHGPRDPVRRQKTIDRAYVYFSAKASAYGVTQEMLDIEHDKKAKAWATANPEKRREVRQAAASERRYHPEINKYLTSEELRWVRLAAGGGTEEEKKAAEVRLVALAADDERKAFIMHAIVEDTPLPKTFEIRYYDPLTTISDLRLKLDATSKGFVGPEESHCWITISVQPGGEPLELDVPLRSIKSATVHVARPRAPII